jgi:hypothetical protein
MSKTVFSDEATDKVNVHKCRIWAPQKPRTSAGLERAPPKVKVSCAFSEQKVYASFFLVENAITGAIYLDMLENWLWSQLTEVIEQEMTLFQ